MPSYTRIFMVVAAMHDVVDDWLLDQQTRW